MTIGFAGASGPRAILRTSRLPPDDPGEPLAERLAAELEVVGVATVLVVVVDPADDLEPRCS